MAASGGTSGLSIGHASPEAAAGGAIGLVRNGDRIRIDIPNRRIDVLVSDEELARRRAEQDAKGWKPPAAPRKQGVGRPQGLCQAGDVGRQGRGARPVFAGRLIHGTRLSGRAPAGCATVARLNGRSLLNPAFCRASGRGQSLDVVGYHQAPAARMGGDVDCLTQSAARSPRPARNGAGVHAQPGAPYGRTSRRLHKSLQWQPGCRSPVCFFSAPMKQFRQRDCRNRHAAGVSAEEH